MQITYTNCAVVSYIATHRYCRLMHVNLKQTFDIIIYYFVFYNVNEKLHNFDWLRAVRAITGNSMPKNTWQAPKKYFFIIKVSLLTVENLYVLYDMSNLFFRMCFIHVTINLLLHIV